MSRPPALRWDALVRLVHWSVAALVAWDWFEDSGGPLHRQLGYAAAALVALRLAWAGLGPPPARFADWWPQPRRLAAYLRAWRTQGRPPQVEGHNPLGALMMLALWACILALAATGWASRLDAFWGDERLQALHGDIADVLVTLALVHVLAVGAMSRLTGENLLRRMGFGRRPDG